MILRKSTEQEISKIWEILQQAILQRKLDGSEQWQNGYPNLDTVKDDFANESAYVFVENDAIVAYAAIIFGEEPAYNAIQGKWLTEDAYVVVHRVAISNDFKGKGIATQLFLMIEDLAIQQGVHSIKVDTNFDNLPMLKILERLEYVYCGEIMYDGFPRKAFEKVLK